MAPTPARCGSCAIVVINGVRCHETGCPDAWGDYKRECKWCGSEFKPENKWDDFCDPSCFASYNGLPDPTETEEVFE